MAKKLSTQAQLQLSVTQALEKIKKLSAELKAVKEQASQPLKVDVQLDLTKFNQQADQIKKVLGGTRNNKGQFSTIASEVRAIRTELTKLNTSIKTIGESLGVVGKTGEQVSKNINRSLSGNNQQITGLVNNVEQFSVTLRKSSEEADNFKSKSSGAFSAAMTGLSSLVSGANQAYAAFRSVGTGFLSTLGNIANKAMDTVGFSVNGMVDEAMEQERKLQQSAIGFRNMFPNQDPNAAIKLVRKTASESPGLNSGDLADYINQLGAVAGGNFDTAYNATLGILKTVQYGGGDAASQMNYIIKNVRDVMAKGKATQVDIQQFNRAMPLLAKAMDAIGASEFLKDGQLTITKDNAPKLMEAFANLNTPDNPAYGIYADTAKTLAGIQEEFREATASTIAEGLENIGFFDALSGIMRKTVLPEIQGDIKTFFRWISEIAGDIDWKEVQKTVGEVVKEIKELIGELAAYLKDNVLNTDGIKLAIRVVGEFIKGLISGAKTLAEWLNGIRQYLGDEGLMNLANTLGATVTQGWLASKALAAVAGVLETVSHVAEARFFFSRNVGGGSSVASSGLGFLSGSTANGSFASNVGQKVATKTGARYTTVTKAVAGAGKAASFVKSAAGAALKGGGIVMVGDALSDMVDKFNLAGDASFGVSQALQALSKIVGGGVMGSFLGLPGIIAGALGGVLMAVDSFQQALNQKEAEESEEEVVKDKLAGSETIMNKAIEVYRENGGAIDLDTNSGIWAYNQAISYLRNTPSEQWDYRKVMDVIARSMRQKTIQEKLAQVDNEEGFWDLQGSKVEFTKEDNGVRKLTDEGRRFGQFIKDYNLVGWDNVEELQNAGAEALISEYTKGKELNSTQLDLLYSRAAEFEQEVAQVSTDTTDKAITAIENAGGSVNAAIEEAKEAGDETLANMLQMWAELNQVVEDAKKQVRSNIEGDNTATHTSIEDTYGEDWANKNDQWTDKTNWFSGGSNWLFGNGGNWALKDWTGEDNFYGMFDKIQSERSMLNDTVNNPETNEDQRKQAQKQIELIDRALEDMKNLDAGDWDGLYEIIKKLINTLYQKYSNTNLLSEWGKGKVRDNRKGISNKKYIWDSDSYSTYANGGEIRPIFRAGGGASGRGVDIVPAFLQPGEFVQRKTAVETAGLSVMQALNNGDIASAYKLLGSKTSGNWNNSRNDYSSRDNRHYQNNNFFIRNYNRSGRAGTQNSLANHLALGY